MRFCHPQTLSNHQKRPVSKRIGDRGHRDGGTEQTDTAAVSNADFGAGSVTKITEGEMLRKTRRNTLRTVYLSVDNKRVSRDMSLLNCYSASCPISPADLKLVTQYNYQLLFFLPTLRVCF